MLHISSSARSRLSASPSPYVSADFLIYARLFGVDSSSPAGKLISSFSYPAIYNLAVDFGASDFSVVAAVVAAGVAAGVAADEESDGFKAAS